ncbi:Squalene synthase 10, partial [Linum perenne]
VCSYQEAIEDITKRMGAGMAKFILKEVETVDDYDEYCHYVAGLVGLGLSKLFHASGKEDLASDSLSNSMGLFLQIMAIGTLAMCYNNVEVFRGVVKMRRGLTAKVINDTKTMADVYGAFHDFSLMLKSKVDKNDPNATKTLSRLEAIQDTCRGSGLLSKRKSYILESKNQHSRFLIVLLVIIMAIVFARLNSK